MAEPGRNIESVRTVFEAISPKEDLRRLGQRTVPQRQTYPRGSPQGRNSNGFT